ncbi:MULTISPECIES: polyphosphate--glucose phosphotransferase [unclassified Nesterenkonia]|uniref:polyphosphate--glucose phosphotransferase n=1 Tax=unclassified Nesterenkonia TaxID=2629769 RepID=UPI001F4C622A|nr:MULTISPECIES: ROK family protein [unclassified Nesterenkonia]MCH8559178.1 ROK family protein [Nesterenkonia sp. DZ6]MCH8571525.1 ROK family protein [Nesterenkonia sp. AY15]
MSSSHEQPLAAQSLGSASETITDLPKRAIGIDVGGTGIKGGLVNLHKGTLTGERFRIPTPKPATPEAVAEVIGQILDELLSREKAPALEELSVGVLFPAIVDKNIVLSAANIDQSWINTDAAKLLRHLPGQIHTLNDADGAGLAEARYGAGKGLEGTVMTITLGTGIGSALVHDGVLVPNSEMGHLEFEGEVAEKKASAAARERTDMPWDEYGQLLNRFLKHVERLQSPELFIIGGGISKRSEDFLPEIKDLRAKVEVAALQNNAGIVGAALYAAEQTRLNQSRGRS